MHSRGAVAFLSTRITRSPSVNARRNTNRYRRCREPASTKVLLSTRCTACDACAAASVPVTPRHRTAALSMPAVGRLGAVREYDVYPSKRACMGLLVLHHVDSALCTSGGLASQKPKAHSRLCLPSTDAPTCINGRSTNSHDIFPWQQHTKNPNQHEARGEHAMACNASKPGTGASTHREQFQPS